MAAILVAAALLVFAPAASAVKSETYHQKAEVVAELGGEGTNGFGFNLFTFDRGVVLTFSRPAGRIGLEDVGYYAVDRHGLGGLKDGRIYIKVGDRGHFRGHFVTKSTKVQKPSRNCKGDPTTTEEGYFAGSFVFHGELGYTTVHARRAKGSISRLGATDCRAPAETGGKKSHGPEHQEIGRGTQGLDEISLLAADRKADVVFQARREPATKAEGPAAAIFQVTESGDRVGPFLVSRSAFIFDIGRGAGSSFLLPKPQEPLAEQIVEPPAPFFGSATFKLAGPKKASWTGDLAVELPGGGKLPLTGDELRAGACRGAKDCTETLPPRLAEMLEADNSYYVGGEATAELQTIR
jgi:hypothetical protein